MAAVPAPEDAPRVTRGYLVDGRLPVTGVHPELLRADAVHDRIAGILAARRPDLLDGRPRRRYAVSWSQFTSAGLLPLMPQLSRRRARPDAGPGLRRHHSPAVRAGGDPRWRPPTPTGRARR
ncbi:hypothetical protein SFUMM280S_01406 [Streptomyces fumanus]